VFGNGYVSIWEGLKSHQSLLVHCEGAVDNAMYLESQVGAYLNGMAGINGLSQLVILSQDFPLLMVGSRVYIGIPTQLCSETGRSLLSTCNMYDPSGHVTAPSIPTEVSEDVDQRPHDQPL